MIKGLETEIKLDKLNKNQYGVKIEYSAELDTVRIALTINDHHVWNRYVAFPAKFLPAFIKACQELAEAMAESKNSFL